jgi:hypothetical protein
VMIHYTSGKSGDVKRSSDFQSEQLFITESHSDDRF